MFQFLLLTTIKNLFKEEDPTNCTEVCKNTSDGFPVCDCTDPENGNASTPVNPDPSPKYVPKDDVDVALPDILNPSSISTDPDTNNDPDNWLGPLTENANGT
mgnify:CR=1 FL=1